MGIDLHGHSPIGCAFSATEFDLNSVNIIGVQSDRVDYVKSEKGIMTLNFLTPANEPLGLGDHCMESSSGTTESWQQLTQGTLVMYFRHSYTTCG